MSSEPKYILVVGGDACDQCASMAGEYDEKPQVPIHPNCKCRVVETGKGNTHYEIRNLEVDIETYTWDGEFITSGHNYENKEVTITVQVECGIIEEAYDEGVEEELHWEPECHTDSAQATIPAQSSFEVRGEIEYTRMVCAGERWAICEIEDPIAGFQHEEWYVGPAGGMAIARTGINSIDVEFATETA